MNIEYEKKIIDEMSHKEMAIAYRFSSMGHPYFDSSSPLCKYFIDKWKKLGGMTTKISKEIGWE